jgi:Ca2+ transporting ATPase
MTNKRNNATDMELVTLQSINIVNGTSNNQQNLKLIGGVDELARKLGVKIIQGAFSTTDINYLRLKFGTNDTMVITTDNLIHCILRIFWESGFIILFILSIIYFGYDILDESGWKWTNPIAICIISFLVCLLSATFYSFYETQNNNIIKKYKYSEKCIVIRDNKIENILSKDIVIGDIICLQVCIQHTTTIIIRIRIIIIILLISILYSYYILPMK